MSFGADLRTERESRGAALESVSEATKVPTRHLLALEQDRYDMLPGGVFNKGIVRSYCQFLGIQAEPWLERMPGAILEEHTIDWTEFAENVQRNRVTHGPRMALRWWGVLLMLLILTGLSWAAWRYVVKPRLQLAAAVSTASAPAIVQISAQSAHFA